jgi:hypothetical protein
MPSLTWQGLADWWMSSIWFDDLRSISDGIRCKSDDANTGTLDSSWAQFRERFTESEIFRGDFRICVATDGIKTTENDIAPAETSLRIFQILPCVARSSAESNENETQ